MRLTDSANTLLLTERLFGIYIFGLIEFTLNFLYGLEVLVHSEDKFCELVLYK